MIIRNAAIKKKEKNKAKQILHSRIVKNSSYCSDFTLFKGLQNVCCKRDKRAYKNARKGVEC